MWTSGSHIPSPCASASLREFCLLRLPLSEFVGYDIPSWVPRILLSVVVLLLAASVLVGLAAAWGKLNIADDYFLAGRQLPWYAVAVSLAAAGLGLESLLGMAGLAYKEGMAPAALCWGNFLAYSILLWVVVPYLVRKKLSSMGELLERRFARSTRAVYAAVMLAFMIFGVLAPALAAAGAAVCDAGLGRPPEGAAWLFIVAMVVVAAAAGVYSIYGGLAATSRAAMLQLLVVLAGGVLLVALGSRGLGGVEGVVKKNLAADPGRLGLLLPAASESLPWIGVLMFWFTLSLGYAAGTQLSVQRCLGARSEWDAKMGVIGAGVLQVLLPAVLVLPGLVAYVRLGTHDISAATPDRTFLRLIQAVFSQEGVWGPLGRGLAVSAVVAAAMCVVGAVLNAASTLWSIDISQDMLLRTASEADMIRRGRWSSLAALRVGPGGRAAVAVVEPGPPGLDRGDGRGGDAAAGGGAAGGVLLAAGARAGGHVHARLRRGRRGLALGGPLRAAGAAGVVLRAADAGGDQRHGLRLGARGRHDPDRPQRLRALRSGHGVEFALGPLARS